MRRCLSVAECKFCKEKPLYWMRHRGMWRLCYADGTLHECVEYHEHKIDELRDRDA